MSERKNQRQIWSDKEFVERLSRIQARRLLNGDPVKNIGQLTKEMLSCPSFEQLEKELVMDHKKLGIKLKNDSRSMFG